MVVGKTIDRIPGPNPSNLIQAERTNAAFVPEVMNYFLEGSKRVSEEIQIMIEQMEKDPVLASRSDYYDMTKDQLREVTLKKINRLSQYLELESFDLFEKRMSLISVFDPQLHTRIGVHLGLFLGCVRGNGTFEQLNYWGLEKGTAFVRQVYGCFGMTELAHGSNVAGLQTTATFDEKNDIFVINTPNIGATKWWIGGAAHSATHCSVYARLIVKGQDYGVKTFIVPLRDVNHNLMPGVTIGDIGAKMGRDGIDNGWIQFSHVKIPRYFMLQKYCKVTSSGEVTLPENNQLSYGALLGGRVVMVKDSFRWLSRCITIATRYGVGRRQFKAATAKESDDESQLMNYPLHQRRLIPILALCYAFSNGANVLARSARDANNILEDAVRNEDKDGMKEGIALTKALFIASGSLKSTCTWLTLENIDKCRQACGGHGYSAYAGFAKAFNDFAVQCTWEGDNNILGMSVGKQLVKQIEAVLTKGEQVGGILEFLNDSKKYLDSTVVLSLEDLNSTDKILTAVQVAIIRGSHQCLKTLKSKNDDWDYIGADLVTLSKLLAHFFLLKAFLDKVKTMDKAEDKPLIPILDNLAKLYSYTTILETFSGNFLTYSVISPDAMTYLSTVRIQELCAELRPHVIPLTDSFQLSDMMINSSIGGYEGNFYEEYFNIVKANNPIKEGKAPYNDAIVTMLQRLSYDDRTRQEFTDEVAEMIDPEQQD